MKTHIYIITYWSIAWNYLNLQESEATTWSERGTVEFLMLTSLDGTVVEVEASQEFTLIVTSLRAAGGETVTGVEASPDVSIEIQTIGGNSVEKIMFQKDLY